ncbi:LysR family transcriptional regulator [Roseomonas frigidaquae]|uniref:LysR family transcriptional regulator n=1 Tax=Falsiroseomonas frigidaquae TaxID=487318 RepID=A0ABX1EXJ1_9PROT|nr:LysR substrate-binding domain-containing protein [Falsiroseomonas frigidaquae]NKE44806.1 LysR family transcriptional regulator [Falsiroseomonas frigidaquae]
MAMNLNLRELQVFRAVMEQGGVTAAAASLGMSQPSASKMLQQAEERLGFALFVRQRKRLVPTAEAHALLPELVGAFTALDDLGRLAEDLRGGRSGLLTLVAVPALTTTLLPRAIARFRRSRPEVALALRAVTAIEAVNLVADHRADLALILGTTVDGRTEARSLFTSEIGCALPPGHALAAKRALHLADILDQPLISLGPQQPVGAVLHRALAEAGRSGRIAMEVSQSAIACALVREGAGVAVLDGVGLQEARSQGLPVRRLLPRTRLAVSLLRPRHRAPSRLEQDFVAVLDQVVAEEGRAP